MSRLAETRDLSPYPKDYGLQQIKDIGIKISLMAARLLIMT